ncbi:hypothetical protein MT0566 [Mycobacterium tuberculosis CDC1551]|uniref:Integral membrane protein n=1 Tax=Mycobacterium tuberculosis (strain CDC 1551 / Oshkosh) TaxID=83331 RepID=Q8VKJ4_MYCTO|nr:hypothetical protein MT0566 [Mycobacterium tuberculosis CDC1551]
MRIGRREGLAVAIGFVLVGAAFVLPRLNLGIKPRSDIGLERFATRAGAAPIFGYWDAHVGWGTAPAVLTAVAVVAWGPVVAHRLPWRVLTLSTWATAAAWAFSLAMIDGWQRGFAGRLTTRDEYLWQVPGIADIPATLRTFTSRILDFQPNSWVTHVSGHPPGALLTFVWLDRIGLRGGGWAGLVCLLVGSSAAAAVLIAVRVLASEQMARRTAPFVAVAPTAIWIAVSADGYFAGVAAWGIALLAVAVHGATRFPALVAAGAGLLLGWGVFLQLRARADRAAGDGGVGRRRLAARPAGTGAGRAGGAGGRGELRGCRILLVRRLYPCPATLLAGDRQRSAVRLLVLGKLGVRGLRYRVRQRRRSQPGIRPGRDQSSIRLPSAAAGGAGRHRLGRPEHAEQSRDRTNLAALHHLADRGARTAAAPLAPTLAGGQRRRGPTAEQHHLHQLVSKCAGAASESSRAGSLREPTPRSAAIAYQRDVVHDVEVAQTLH